MEFVKLSNMGNQNLLENILNICCDAISDSIIINLQFEHNVNDVIFNNEKRDFINKVRVCLMYFFCNIDNSNLGHQKKTLLEDISGIFEEDIFTYLNSRADLDTCKIRKAINRGIEDWLL